MNVNATFFVQIVNFIIVYIMLRQFLFRPTISIIEQERTDKRGLIDIIEQQKKSLEIQQQELQRVWFICQEYFTNHRPFAQSKNVVSIEQDTQITIPLLSEESIAGIVVQMSDVLQEKIKNVH